MTQVPTAMRAAFADAHYVSEKTPSNKHVQSALKRKVGLVTRKIMWSIQRGKR